MLFQNIQIRVSLTFAKHLKKAMIKNKSFFYTRKDLLIQTYYNSLLATQKPLRIYTTRTHIQKIILYSETGFKRSF